MKIRKSSDTSINRFKAQVEVCDKQLDCFTCEVVFSLSQLLITSSKISFTLFFSASLSDLQVVCNRTLLPLVFLWNAEKVAAVKVAVRALAPKAKALVA